MTKYLITLLTCMMLSAVSYCPASEQSTPLKVQAASGPQDLSMTGPTTVSVGQPISIVVSGLPAVDLSKPIGEQTRWIELIRFDTSSPKDATVILDKELSMGVSPWEWRLRLTFTPLKAGVYVVVCDWNEPPFGLALHRVDVGGTTPTLPTDPPVLQNLRITYVYEKDQGPIPPQVASTLQKLNQQALAAGGTPIADEFEEDTTDGNGEVPDKSKVALVEARKAGLPALVIERPDVAPVVVKSPKTEADIMEALQ